MTKVDINQLELPKVSHCAEQALSMLSHPDPDLRDLENVIMGDPILAAGLLKYANSPLYRRSSEVSNVHTAVCLLGSKNIRSAIVSAVLHHALPQHTPITESILHHMVRISMLCKQVAAEVSPAHIEDLEFLGLIHDVGMLVLAVNFQSEYKRLVLEAAESEMSTEELEQKWFGIDHDSVGKLVAREFRLPAQHVELMASYHKPLVLDDFSNEVQRDYSILEIAHHMYIALYQHKIRFVIDRFNHPLQELCDFSGLKSTKYTEMVQYASGW